MRRSFCFSACRVASSASETRGRKDKAATTWLMLVRPAEVSDVPALLILQACVHPVSLLESRACFTSIVSCCLSSVVVKDDTVIGYALAHPGRVGALDSVTFPVSLGETGALFLHDVVVSPHFRNCRLGTRLVEAVMSAARSHRCLEVHLVALPGTLVFWGARGFTLGGVEYGDASSYGPGAVHLVRFERALI